MLNIYYLVCFNVSVMLSKTIEIRICNVIIFIFYYYFVIKISNLLCYYNNILQINSWYILINYTFSFIYIYCYEQNTIELLKLLIYKNIKSYFYILFDVHFVLWLKENWYWLNKFIFLWISLNIKLLIRLLEK